MSTRAAAAVQFEQESFALNGEIIDRLVHEVQNTLHTISLEFELLQLAQPDLPEGLKILPRIERTSRVLREVNEYFSPPESCSSVENVELVLQEVTQRIEQEWQPRGLSLCTTCRTPFPLLQLDWRQFRQMLPRVLAFIGALAPSSGTAQVKAELRKIDGRRYLQLLIAAPLVPTLNLDGQDLFRPFLRINGYQTGVSLVLARRYAQSHHGQIAFHVESRGDGRWGICTIQLETRPAQQ